MITTMKPPLPDSKAPQKIGAAPELEILLCCARTQISSEQADRVKDLVAQDINWQVLIEKASYHKVLPLLYTNLKSVCPEAIPDSALKTLEQRFRITAQRNMLLAGELVRVLSSLSNHEVVAVPYKGPVLASLLYGNIALRPSSDLDILVQLQDILRAKELLIALGYRPKREMTHAQEMAYLDSKTEHTYDFIHPGKRITVELHWRIEPVYSSVIELKHFWYNLEVASFAEQQVVNLSLENWLPILCVHASRHIWERLMWLCDIAELLQVQPEIDWQKVMRQADQLGYRRILLVGLCLANKLLATALPPEITQQIAADRQVGLITSKLCSNFIQGTDADQELLGTTLYHIRIRERISDKALYFRWFLHWLMKRKK